MDQNTKERYNIHEILSDKKELTEKDILTLFVLMKEGRITNPKLLEKLNLMGANLSDPNSVAHHRKKLEKLGIIKKYCAKIDWAKVGYPTQFVVIATSNNKDVLLEIEKGHIAGIKKYKEKTGADIFFIPLSEEGNKIILRDVLFGGEKPMAIISGIATDDGAAMMFANFYLPKRFPGIDTTLLIIKRSSIRDFEFQDKFIDSTISMLFNTGEDIEEYMEVYEKEFRWDWLKHSK